MNHATSSDANTAGCSLGTAISASPPTKPLDAIAILQFGAPVHGSNPPSTEGATLFVASSSGWATIPTIRQMAQQFAVGWWDCGGRTVSSATVRIAIATSNDTLATASGWTTSEIQSHADHWANAVENANTWAGNNPSSGPKYSTKVFFVGGSDIEPYFDGPTKAKTWVTGYANHWTGLPVAYRLLDTGSSDGCPTTWTAADSGTASCNAVTKSGGTVNWPVSNLAYDAWTSGISSPAPQDYNTSQTQAKQWRWLSEWGYKYTSANRMNFWDATSQAYVCNNQPNFPCPSGTNNSPQNAWQYLYDWINCNSGPTTPCHTQDDIRWSTNFRWYHNS